METLNNKNDGIFITIIWGLIAFIGICFVLEQNNKHFKALNTKLDKLITVAEKY